MAPASGVGVLAGRRSLQATSGASYTCLQCQLCAYRASHKTNPSFRHFPTRRHASFMDTETWRKRIWGPNPPGPKDPYRDPFGPPSVLDRMREERQRDNQEEPRDVESRTEAPKEDIEGNFNTEGYEPATTWERLPRIGGDTWAKQQYASAHPFEGFMYSKLGSREEIIMAVHQALVEVFTLKQADLPLSIDVNPTTSVPHNEYLRWLAEDASFEKTENGEIQLVLGSKELQDAILDSIMPKEPTENETADAGAVMEQQQPIEEGLVEANNPGQADDADGLEGSAPAIDRQPVEVDRTETDKTFEAFPLVESLESSNTEVHGGPTTPASDSWRNVPLEDQAVKFAVLKRVMQLTGTRISDPNIGNITNSSILLTHLVKKPKAKKLADNLISKELAELPNVQISKRRYGPIDKEKEVGRWKIIKQELERLGLQPIKGRGIGRKPVTL